MRGVPAGLEAEVKGFAEDEELNRRDVWLFAPLIAVLVAMPLVIVTVLSVGLWVAAQRFDLSLTNPAQTTFASRWPDRALPETVIR